MRKNIVLTLAGHDRIGIVERITKEVLNGGGNIVGSRMARLGGEFADAVPRFRSSWEVGRPDAGC